MSVDHVRQALTPFGVADRILQFPCSTATVALAAAALNCEEGRIAKTLSFMANGKPLLVVMAGDKRVDNAAFKATFQAKAKMMNAEELETYTGLHFGGVCPFGIPDDVDIWLDESLHAYEYVYPAAGSEDSAIKVTCEELERFSGAKGWVHVSK